MSTVRVVDALYLSDKYCADVRGDLLRSWVAAAAAKAAVNASHPDAVRDWLATAVTVSSVSA